MQHAQGQYLRQGLVSIIPEKMRARPVDHRGYPVPWFVAYIDGKPDFRIMDPRKWQLGIDKRRCWLCGQGLGKFGTFVAGLMCIVTHTSAEPPSHIECAKFAVRACPFLTIPTAQYRSAKLPSEVRANEGAIMDNPEVTALWTTDQWRTECGLGDDGLTRLVKFGEPRTVSYWTRGRPATDQEVASTFWRRLPILQQVAEQDGGDAPQKLAGMVEDALFWLPAQAG
jgi:ferredoxin